MLKVLYVPFVVKLCVVEIEGLSRAERLTLTLSEELPVSVASSSSREPEGDALGQAVEEGLSEKKRETSFATVRVGDTRAVTVMDGVPVELRDDRAEAVKDTLAVGVLDAEVDAESVFEGAPVRVPPINENEAVVLVVDDELGANDCEPVPQGGAEGVPPRTLTVSVPERTSLGDKPTLRLTVSVGSAEGVAWVADPLDEGSAVPESAEGEALSVTQAVGESPSEGVDDALPREDPVPRSEAELERDARSEREARVADAVLLAACVGDAARLGLVEVDGHAEGVAKLAEAEADAAALRVAIVAEGVNEPRVEVTSGEADTNGV